MTRRSFRQWFVFVGFGIGLIILALGFAAFKTSKEYYYEFYKDLMPLISTLYAAVLAGFYQHRSSFLSQLRGTWSHLLNAVQGAVQFTHLKSPDESQFAETMKQLSYVIDDFRSLYKNVDQDVDGTGFFPYESLKKIHGALSTYHADKDYSYPAGKAARQAIILNWQSLREAVLDEFDRSEPTYHDTPFKQ